MASALHRFETYYKEKHDRHRMAWFHSLGTTALTSRFPGGNKEISVSMYQALVLLLFNEQDQFSAAEIQSRTRLSEYMCDMKCIYLKPGCGCLGQEDLTVTLQSLALGKKHVLLRADGKATKDIALEDQFKWNSEFTDPKRNIRIPSIQQQTTVGFSGGAYVHLANRLFRSKKLKMHRTIFSVEDRTPSTPLLFGS